MRENREAATVRDGGNLQRFSHAGEKMETFPRHRSKVRGNLVAISGRESSRFTNLNTQQGRERGEEELTEEKKGTHHQILH